MADRFTKKQFGRNLITRCIKKFNLFVSQHQTGYHLMYSNFTVENFEKKLIFCRKKGTLLHICFFAIYFLLQLFTSALSFIFAFFTANSSAFIFVEYPPSSVHTSSLALSALDSTAFAVWRHVFCRYAKFALLYTL